MVIEKIQDCHGFDGPAGRMLMKGALFEMLLGVLMVCMMTSDSSWAGQVVTDELRVWAKEAVGQEKNLDTVTQSNTLAVLYFHNKTGWSKLDLIQKGLSLMLITDLSKIKEIQLVERVKMQALVEELGLSVSGLVSLDKAPRVGRLLGAKLLVGGNIVRSKDNLFQLKSDLLNVPTESLLGNPLVEGKLLAELFRMEKDLLFKIIELLRIKLTPKLKIELERPLTTSIEAVLYLFKGIEDADQENYDEATKSFSDALKQDPGLTTAIMGIREIYKTKEGGFKPATGQWRIPRSPKEALKNSCGKPNKPCAAERNKILKSLPRGF